MFVVSLAVATYRLQPTYEGLKHASTVDAIEGVTGLQPTYEGLKLAIVLVCVFLFLGLQPTYEGLKHDWEVWT